MKSLMSLWSQVAAEAATRCCTSATADINTASRRFEHEGVSFLTITLPAFGKSFEKWLDQGFVDPIPAFRGWKGLPRFLGGFLDRVFDRCSGLLLEDYCIESVSAIRQLTLFEAKIALPCSKARVRQAMREFIECEQDVRRSDSRLSRRDLTEFQQMSDLLYEKIFTKMDRDVHYGDLIPQHGPGAVADKLSSNGKYRNKTWTRRLEGVLPSYEYLIPNARYSSELDQVSILEPGAEMPVKVIPVPKTLKTPRIIAVEPTCMQYTQQALKRSFMGHFEKDNFLPKVIGFLDQTPNQEMARKGSIDTRTATLDLSEASDRVSNLLVKTMMHRWPSLIMAFDATRSKRAYVREFDETIELAKYASMGSALCFPVEAMVFTTLIFVGIQRSLNKSLTRRDLHNLARTVRVYGDDLIVPVDHVHHIIAALEHFGAKVGRHKSFWTGKFRESCGKEYYGGEDVSIVRIRQPIPTDNADVKGVIATVALRNQLYMSGYWKTAGWLDNRIRKVIRHFPNVEPTSPLLGRICSLGYQPEKYHPKLYNPLVKGYKVEAKPPSDELDGYGALLKCFLQMETRVARQGGSHATDYNASREPVKVSLNGLASSWAAPESHDEKHLERSGRPKAVCIKPRWCTPY
jgi:hypothetical protein